MKLVYPCLLTLFVVLTLTTCQKVSSPPATSMSLQTNGQIAFCGRKDGSERFDVYLENLTTREWHNLTEKYISKIDNAFDQRLRKTGFVRQ